MSTHTLSGLFLNIALLIVAMLAIFSGLPRVEGAGVGCGAVAMINLILWGAQLFSESKFRIPF